MKGLGLGLGLSRAASGSSFTPVFTLTNMVESPANTFTKNTAAPAWDAKAQTGPYTGDMSFTYLVSVPTDDSWAGFVSDSSALSNLQGEAVIYYQGGGNSYKYTGASTDGLSMPYTASTVERFERVGGTINFYRDDILKATWTVSASTPLYFVFGEAWQNGQFKLLSAA